MTNKQQINRISVVNELIIIIFASLSIAVIIMQIVDNDNMDKTLFIAGMPLVLALIEKDKLKGLSLDTLLSFQFYQAKFNQQELCIAESIDSGRLYTPMQYNRIANTTERILGMPIAFYLPTAPSYIRSRLIKQGVYFIISDQYVFLPEILINERFKRTHSSRQQLSPVGQYMLLYYLLHQGIKKFTIQEILPSIPYNYLAISRAISELEELQLFHSEKEWKTKLISSPFARKALWQQALQLLSSPVKKTVYANHIWDAPFYKAGITALSHYSFLNSEEQQTVAIWEKDFDSRNEVCSEWGASELKYKIEIWKYAPQMDIEQNGFVDMLSLYLSLQDDKDPRTEKELETIINKIWQ
jgi:hypothetical protein